MEFDHPTNQNLPHALADLSLHVQKLIGGMVPFLDGVEVRGDGILIDRHLGLPLGDRKFHCHLDCGNCPRVQWWEIGWTEGNVMGLRKGLDDQHSIGEVLSEKPLCVGLGFLVIVGDERVFDVHFRGEGMESGLQSEFVPETLPPGSLVVHRSQLNLNSNNYSLSTFIIGSPTNICIQKLAESGFYP